MDIRSSTGPPDSLGLTPAARISSIVTQSPGQELREHCFAGVGLHSGERCHVRIELMEPGAGRKTGIVFRTAEGPVPVAVACLRSTELCTVLEVGGASVSTVEHLLAALTALGHFAAEIRVEGPEVPILDGSAAAFVERLPDAGYRTRELVVETAFELREDSARAWVEPAGSLQIDYSIDFPASPIGRQRLLYTHCRSAFRSQIAPARTFTLAKHVEVLRERGLIRGGSLDCALVFAPHRLLNPPLRFADEPVRHKVLDLLGDLALLGRPLKARLRVQRGGHRLHAVVVSELLTRFQSGAGVRLHEQP